MIKVGCNFLFLLLSLIETRKNGIDVVGFVAGIFSGFNSGLEGHEGRSQRRR